MSNIWPDCMNRTRDRYGAAFSCKGYGALLAERDALGARLSNEQAISAEKRIETEELQEQLAEAQRLLTDLVNYPGDRDGTEKARQFLLSAADSASGG